MPERARAAIGLLVVLLLSGCGMHASAPKLGLSQARLVPGATGTVLQANVRFVPSPVQLEALDHGVPLTLRLQLTGAGDRQTTAEVVLRYFPLSRRYQMHLSGGADRSFALRGYLLDALQRLELPLPDDPCARPGACRLRVGLDYSALPGALRLPALIRPAWHLSPVQADVLRDSA